MAQNLLVTGSPVGNILYQEDRYIEGAPFIFVQDYNANPLFNPDSDGYYWQMSGTTTYPVYNLGCFQKVSLDQKVTMKDIICDTVGARDTVQKLDYIEFTFQIQSLLPLNQIRTLLKLSTATVNAGTHSEKVGIPQINNNQRYMLYAPKVYDDTNGYWLAIHLHRAKPVDAWKLAMPYGDGWTLTGLKFRAFADTTKPVNQWFGVITRVDSNAL